MIYGVRRQTDKQTQTGVKAIRTTWSNCDCDINMFNWSLYNCRMMYTATCKYRK